MPQSNAVPDRRRGRAAPKPGGVRWFNFRPGSCVTNASTEFGGAMLHER